MRRIPPDEERVLHERALRKDPVVLIDLLKFFVKRIEGFVRHDLSCDQETAYDAVIDVLFTYVKAPERYDPDRALLVTYLTKAAKYRVRDQLKSRESRTHREQNYASDVELHEVSPKDILENYVEASRVLDRLIERKILKNEREVAFLRLILSGEGSTEVLARVLELETSSQEELRREVKRHRDRLMKMLERFGKEDPDDPA